MQQEGDVRPVAADQYRQLRRALARNFGPLDGVPAGFDSWLSHAGSLPSALLCAPLFLPPLVEYGGRIYHTFLYFDDDPDGLAHHITEQLQATGGNARQVQALQNHLHLFELFGDNPIDDRGEDADDVVQELALLTEVLAQSWRGWLAVNYPGREFVVETTNPLVDWPDDEDWDIYDLTVTFYEDRP